MNIDRLFTVEGTDPYSLFEYEPFDCVLTHHETKETLLEMRGVEVPKHWSINARNILISKYFRKSGVPSAAVPTDITSSCPVPYWLRPCEAVKDATFGAETSIRQVVHRIVGHWTYTAYINGYFDPSRDEVATYISQSTAGDPPSTQDATQDLRDRNAHAYYDEMVYMMVAQIAAPNSPQWFNTGLWWSYGINSPAQGHYFAQMPADTRRVTTPAAGTPVINELMDGDVGQARTALSPWVKPSPDAYSHVQAHACFILAVADTLLGENGIIPWIEREARIFKYGSGSGANLSHLRAKHEPLSGGGKSSGLMSWIESGDRSAGAIKSGGTTRRAAKMVCVDLNHPDILDFIGSKPEAEVAVAAMIAGSNMIALHCQCIMDAVVGAAMTNAQMSDTLQVPTVADAVSKAKASQVPDSYIAKALQLALQGTAKWPGTLFNNDFDGRAYQIAPHQNGNYSVRIPSAFYEAVDRGINWCLTNRTDGKVRDAIPAVQIERSIAEACWFCGDPGAQFHDIINDWNVTPQDGTIDASNPCSEHMRLPNSACNLASIRLMALMKDGKFNFHAFRHAVHLWQITLDITNTMAHLPDAATAANVYLYRDTGLGFADLGALLMAYGLPYDSVEARALAGVIAATMQGQAHVTSAKMAKAMGAYPRFWANRNDHLRCVRNHLRAVMNDTDFEELTVEPFNIDYDALSDALGSEWVDVAGNLRGLWELAYSSACRDGLRNAEMTVLAPTGTIGFVLDCDTTGVEPLFGLKVFKQLVGGGKMDLVSKSVRLGLHRLDYPDAVITEIVKFVADHGRLPTTQGPDGPFFVQEKHWPVFATALTADPKVPAIAWEAHIKMMATVQAFISGAISKTVNMPNEATIDDVCDAFRMAHDCGLKAVAIYRDGSKLSQPLTIAMPKKESEGVPIAINKPLDSVGFGVTDGKPAEPTRQRLGWLRRSGIDVAVSIGSGRLYLRTTKYDDGRVAEIWANYSADQGIIQALLSQLCKTANVALQYGVPLSVIVESWMDSNFKPNGMVGDHPNVKMCKSIVNLMAKLLLYHELGETAHLNVQPASEAIPVRGHVEHAYAAVVPVSPSPLTTTGARISIEATSCPECGANEFIRSGAGCMKCAKCGTAGECG